VNDAPAARLLYELHRFYLENGREEEFPPDPPARSLRTPPALWPIEELLAGREPQFSCPVELDSHPWLLVVLDGSVHLFGFTSPTEAEMRVIGSLAGGAYAERLGFEKDDEEMIELRFTHARLPGTLVVRGQLHRLRPPFKQIRERFRDWAVSPPVAPR
jgi:hypothetical protein